MCTHTNTAHLKSIMSNLQAHISSPVQLPAPGLCSPPAALAHHTEVQQVTELFVCPNCSHSLLLLIHIPTDSTVAVLEKARGRGERYFNDYSKLPTPLMNIFKKTEQRGKKRKTLSASAASNSGARAQSESSHSTQRQEQAFY